MENNNGIEGGRIGDHLIIDFITELQDKISQMDFTVPNNTTIIGYSGESNGKRCFEIVHKITENQGDGARYISNLPAGKLLNDPEFVDELEKIIGHDNIDSLVHGYGKNGKRLDNGSCGYGNGIISLDDFVSAKLMGETVGSSNNIIIFVPETIDPTKVFATTEIEQIFKNSTFEYINGIPKSELETIYRAGETVIF